MPPSKVRKLTAVFSNNKQCSGDEPCHTCANVENARLWKQPCIRERIADRMELYSAGLHRSLADAAQAKLEQIEPTSRRLMAMHEDNDQISLFLDLVRVVKTTEPLYAPPSLGENTKRDTETIALDVKSERLSTSLADYVKRRSADFVNTERSVFMRKTLTVARSMVGREDDLLTRVLELWCVNHILVDDEMKWCTYVLDKMHEHEDHAADEDSSGKNEISVTSYHIITAQLRAQAERQAAWLSKTVMNDLERRLLQRAQSGWFETFLVSVIMINCIERSIWLLKMWEQGSIEGNEPWPLQHGPEYYFAQAERFVEMLQMLLKLGGLPSKIKTTDDGILATEGDEIARRYFEEIQLNEKDLVEKQNAKFDHLDSRSFELRLCSRILLLQNL
jgi:hypothetical protein